MASLRQYRVARKVVVVREEPDFDARVKATALLDSIVLVGDIEGEWFPVTVHGYMHKSVLAEIERTASPNTRSVEQSAAGFDGDSGSLEYAYPDN